jgi:hypothetical protein
MFFNQQLALRADGIGRHKNQRGYDCLIKFGTGQDAIEIKRQRAQT